MEFQDELKRLRASKGITQTKLGEAIHVSRSAVAKWEAGLGLPSEESVLALCVYFEVTKEQLFPNQEMEVLLVEKNQEIRKNKTWLTGLSIFLAVIIAVTVFFVGHVVLRVEHERKRVERLLTLCPTVIDIYFNPRVGLITEEVAFVNEVYIIPYGEWVPLYFEVVLDAQICEQWYEFVPTVENFDVFYLKKIQEYSSYGNDAGLRRQIYSVLVRTEYTEVSSVDLNALLFAYIPNTERIEKYCSLQTNTLPIKVEKSIS